MRVNKYIETRPLILDKANSFPISFSKSYGDFEVSPSPAEAQSLVHHGDAVGHDNDMSKSFGRMADEVCRVARSREGGGSGGAQWGLCVPRQRSWFRKRWAGSREASSLMFREL